MFNGCLGSGRIYGVNQLFLLIFWVCLVMVINIWWVFLEFFRGCLNLMWIVFELFLFFIIKFIFVGLMVCIWVMVILVC